MTRGKCPVCASDEITSHLKRKDLLTVFRCGRCGLKFVDQNDFDAEYGEAGKLYEESYFEGGGDLGFKEYRDAPVSNFYWHKALITLVEGVEGKRVLDIGCGTGKFMGLLARSGALVEGVEISRYAADVAASEGLRIVGRDVRELDDEPVYDIITAFDVIEHVADPTALLMKARALLKDDGVFIFLTPDAGSRKARQLKEEWYGYNSSLEHLFYFSVESLAFLFETAFRTRPFLHQVAAADGEGIIGFLRKRPDPRDEAAEAVFRSNFSSDSVGEANVIAVSLILQRLGDRRFIDYAEKYRDSLTARAGEEEAAFLLSALRQSGQNREREKRRTGVEVRPFREGDEEGIAGLFAEVFGRSMSPEEWRWKYRGQGDGKIFSAVAVDEKDGIVGHYGGVPVRCMLRGRQVRALTSCDVMIRKSRRGFWTLKRLIAGFVGGAIENGFVTTHGFPTEETLMLPAEKLGIMERLAPVYDARKEAVFRSDATRFLYRLFPMEYGDGRIDRLWEAVRESFDFIAVRDATFYAWRYRDNPLHSYRLWGLRKRWSRRLEGIVVTREDTSEELSVMDILCRPGSLGTLLRKTENLACAAGKKGLLLWLPERFHPLLKEMGYDLMYRCVLAQPVGRTFLPQSEIRSMFYFTMGDTDYL